MAAGEEDLTAKVENLIQERKTLEKELQRLASDQLLSNSDALMKKAEKIGDISVITESIPNVTMDQLKTLGDRIRETSQMTAALFSTEQNGKLNLVCIITDDVIKSKSLKAGELVKEAAKVAGGGGGGRPHLATAGARDIDKVQEVFAKFRELIAG
jgi:alanyl-tRNA synthetase